MSALVEIGQVRREASGRVYRVMSNPVANQFIIRYVDGEMADAMALGCLSDKLLRDHPWENDPDWQPGDDYQFNAADGCVTKVRSHKVVARHQVVFDGAPDRFFRHTSWGRSLTFLPIWQKPAEQTADKKREAIIKAINSHVPKCYPSNVVAWRKAATAWAKSLPGQDVLTAFNTVDRFVSYMDCPAGEMSTVARRVFDAEEAKALTGQQLNDSAAAVMALHRDGAFSHLNRPAWIEALKEWHTFAQASELRFSADELRTKLLADMQVANSDIRLAYQRALNVLGMSDHTVPEAHPTKTAFDLVRDELRHARDKHPTQWPTMEHGAFVIGEELRELRDELNKGGTIPRNAEAIQREAAQVAATAIRFLEDCCGANGAAKGGVK